MHRRLNNQIGFTLVELSLAMAFIAMLLLGIALLTIQISAIYNKGLTMRAVNESGQLIASDIQRTLNTSRPQEVIFIERDGGGRLCANNVVYAWNYAGTALTTGSGIRGYNKHTGSLSTPVRFVRFVGDDTYCRPTNPPTNTIYKYLPATNVDNLTALLKSGDNTLAIHELKIDNGSDGNVGQAVKDDSTQRMYHVSFVIGSNDQTLINASGCAVPASEIDDEYCAVNTFDFVARAGNKGVSE